MHAQLNIVLALLIIAVADNVTDSFGIHIYQESQTASAMAIHRTTLMNFLTRLVITFVFIAFVVFLPLGLASVFAVVFGLGVIVGLSYLISARRGVDPVPVILQHLLLAVVVIVATFVLREMIAVFAARVVS